MTNFVMNKVTQGRDLLVENPMVKYDECVKMRKERKEKAKGTKMRCTEKQM